jgi:hypothetical protein
MTERKSTPPLQFKAVNEGLGFHPFSDGLPYAPVLKKRRDAAPSDFDSPRKGSGATVAGPISVSPAITRPAPRVKVPVATQADASLKQTATPAPGPAIGVPVSYRPAAAPAAPIAKASPQPSAGEIPAPRYGLVYVAKRVLAYALDSALNLTAVVSALSFVLVRNDVAPEALVSSGVLLLTLVFLAFFNWAVITAQEIAFGTSIGKRICGLALRGSASAVFLRAFFFLPSAGFAGLGLIWALFNRDRRCWHDVAVDLQPQEVASLG